MKKRYLLANALLLALGTTLTTVQAAPAATITVTTSNDLLDAAANCAAVTLASLAGRRWPYQPARGDLRR